MARTAKQSLGDRGEQLVAKRVRCPGCKPSERTLRVLPSNFKCADIICDFCGYLAQVKTKSVKGPLPSDCPTILPGSAWGPQQERMVAGIYFSLFIVLENDDGAMRIFFLPRDLQSSGMFVPRRPLSATAKRAGWQGFMIDVSKALGRPVRYVDGSADEFRLDV
ncbi:DpnI domain-containing protein [Kibdelosporangium philippinense]